MSFERLGVWIAVAITPTRTHYDNIQIIHMIQLMLENRE